MILGKCEGMKASQIIPLPARVILLGSLPPVLHLPTLFAQMTRLVCICNPGGIMATQQKTMSNSNPNTFAEFNRDELIRLLNEDLSREYQAIIAYINYSQVLKGAEYMHIAQELEKHAAEELQHALMVAKQIDYLGGMPTVEPKAVRTSEDAREMLRFDLQNENETIRNYRERVRQCESLGEFALAEQLRKILVQEQEHQMDLATALGENVPDVTRADERA